MFDMFYNTQNSHVMQNEASEFEDIPHEIVIHLALSVFSLSVLRLFCCVASITTLKSCKIS